jgi:hypothetical protein
MSMLKMFKKRKEVKEENKRAEKAAVFLSKAIITLQTRWASWLSKREQKMSIRQKKISLFIFCIAMGIVAGSALYKGLFGHRNQSPWYKQQSITPPQTIPLPDSLEILYLYELEKKRIAEEKKKDSIHH